MERKWHPLFQLFSVSVHLKDHKPIHLYGTVNTDGILELTSDVVEQSTSEKSIKLYGTITSVDAGGGPRFLFKRSKETPEIISTNDTIPISFLTESRWCTSDCYLDMRIDLKDADRDLEISRGYLIYDHRDPFSYYSKRLASVIPGKDGYATVYYVLFHKAVQAYVKVQLVIDGGVDVAETCIVSGSIFGRYGGHEYTSEYDKKHYQIVIFRRKLEDGAVLSVDGSSKCFFLPLSCPLSAVPFETSFIIDANLVVKSGETKIATVRGSAEFPQVMGDVGSCTPTLEVIVGNNAHLKVTVIWSSYGTDAF